MTASGSLQRSETVIDEDDRQSIRGDHFSDSAGGAAFLCLSDEGVGIEVGAAQRNEQFAGGEFASVDADTRIVTILTVKRTAAICRELSERRHQAATRRTNSLTIA
jgi:hypothetical protein